MTSIAKIRWPKAVRIIRSRFPTIDLFDDIADPRDWPLLIAAEQKTNPRLVDAIGALDLVPPERRVGGPGASYLMSPFTHASPDRPSRFSAGLPGVLYVGDLFEVALAETVFHHGVFMAKTKEPPGWTSQFREIVLRSKRVSTICATPLATLRTTTKIRRSEQNCAPRAQTASSTRASVGRRVSASACSIPTAPGTQSRADTSTITGTASGWTFTAPQDEWDDGPALPPCR